MGYGLDDQGILVWLIIRTTDIFLLCSVQTGSGGHPASCPVAIRDYFPWGGGGGGKPGEAWSWPLTSTKCQGWVCGAIPPLPHPSSWQGQFHILLEVIMKRWKIWQEIEEEGLWEERRDWRPCIYEPTESTGTYMPQIYLLCLLRYNVPQKHTLIPF